jgi:hypothetical protein
MIIACVKYLQAPSGYGGASSDASGKSVVGPKRPDHMTPLVISAVTLPLCIGWVVVLLLWKRAPEDDADLPAAGGRRGVRPR